MTVNKNDRIIMHKSIGEGSDELTPFQVIHVFDGSLVLEYDGAINDDPGNRTVADPTGEDNMYWLHANTYLLLPATDEERLAVWPHSGSSPTFKTYNLL